jgi:murein L,D-transpeptidase YafK
MNYITSTLLVGISSLFIYYFYPENQLNADQRITNLKLIKSERKLYAYENNLLRATYTVALGKNPTGDKKKQGDCATPIGTFHLKKHTHSTFHKAIILDYGYKKPYDASIEIHGLPDQLSWIGKFHRWADWTAGCIAMTNTEIDELYTALKPTCTLVITP